MSTGAPLLAAKSLSIAYGTQQLLDDVSFTIHEQQRVGLVGRNGAGKSTMLRIITGDVLPPDGEISRRKGLRVGFLPQEFTLPPELTVREAIRQGASEMVDLLERYEATGSATLQAAIDACDGWNLDVHIASIMDALKVVDGDRVVGQLSGGEQRRVALCRAIVGQPDLLILDEPTNHLDLATIEWLEDALSAHRGSLLLVTHDRYFLDRVCNRLFDLAHGKLYDCDGNYSDYLLQQAERSAAAEKKEARRQSFLRREIDWVRRMPKARTTKSKSRMERFDAAFSEGPPPRVDSVDLVVPPAPRLANRVIEINDLEIERGGNTLVRDFSFEFRAGQRLGIVGPNGAGKTSLLRCLLEELPASAGEVKLGSLTKINYIDQGRLSLSDDKSVFEEVGEGEEFVIFGDQKLSLWAYLKRFLFTDERIRTTVGRLSGGERNRVLLAKNLKHGGNVLILDEPTNDLDLATLRVLEEALVAFSGTVLVVSHDRYFLNRVCTDILGFKGWGELCHEVGNYDDYREKHGPIQELGADSATPAPAPKAKREKARRLSYREKQELAGIEAAIHTAEEEAETLEALFSEPDFHTNHGHEAEAMMAKLEAAQAEAERLYARWEELEALAAAAG